MQVNFTVQVAQDTFDNTSFSFTVFILTITAKMNNL